MKEESTELIKDNNNNNNNDINSYDYIYEMLFGIVSNIITDKTKLEIKFKQFNILEKIISNIISAEKARKNSENYRKIRINNPNIELILKIKGVYDFLIFLGFKQENNEKDEVYLFLPEEKISLQKLEKSLFYMNLLNINFIDINNEDNLNNYETPEYQENIKQKKLNNKNELPEINIINPNSTNINEAQKILEESGQERYNQALKYSNDNNSNFFSFKTIINFFACDSCRTNAKKEAKKFFEQKKQEDDNKKNLMTLSDLEYKNPDNNSLECKDDIGKECLQLTNEFRSKNNLPHLEWDDSIWALAYSHSKNMGEGVVPFGHKGFNERVNNFNFRYYKACENVYMCQGISQYNTAENAVKSWINSPGHKMNLLSDTSHCAVGVYKNNYGEFYLTQLFALK